MPDLPTLERKLKGVHQGVRNLQVLQMRPGLPAAKLELLRNLERSARAEVKLRLKALEHHKRMQTQLRGELPWRRLRWLRRAESLLRATLAAKQTRRATFDR
jgi:hypothetical protein